MKCSLILNGKKKPINPATNEVIEFIENVYLHKSYQ